MPRSPAARRFSADRTGSRARLSRELCNPVEKRRAGRDPEPILRAEEHLVCYRITTQTPAFAALRVNTTDQFNSLQTLRVRTLERLCVPSSKELPGAGT